MEIIKKNNKTLLILNQSDIDNKRTQTSIRGMEFDSIIINLIEIWNNDLCARLNYKKEVKNDK